MALVGRSYIAFDADLTALYKKLDEAKRAAASARVTVPVSGAGGDGGAGGADRQAASATRAAIAQQRLATAVVNTARADQLLARDTANAAAAQDRAAQAAQRRAAAEARASAPGLGTRGGLAILPRTLDSFGPQAIQQVQSGLIGLLGPVALVTAGFTAARAAIESFGAAFTFKADLDKVNQGIRTNLEGVRDQGAVFREAQQFADRYRLTQKETSDILAASTDTLRTSTASVSELESALLRLQSRDVSKPVSEAARALRELQSGDVTSIKELFNVPAQEALRMKNEIAAGGDAVAVLNDYLERAGVGMGVLENRSKGAAGAFNELTIAQERLALAQAEFVQGPGMILLAAQTNVTRDATHLLSGDIRGLNDALKDSGIATLSVLSPLIDYNTFVLSAGRNALVWAGVVKEANPDLANQAGASDAAGQAALFYANHARAAGDAAAVAAGKVDQLTAAQLRQAAAQGLADQRQGERQGGKEGVEDEKRTQNIFRRLAQPEKDRQAAEAKQAADKARQDADRLADLQLQGRLANAKTNAAKVRILQEQLAKTRDPIERQQLQNQIDQEKNAGGGRVGAAKSTANQLLNVEENSQLQIARAQREGQERIRDQQEDFEVGRGRKQEDFERRRLRLLSQGKRREADLLSEEFQRDQRREQEDFDRQKRRTLRNNDEGVGDVNVRTDLRQQQAGRRGAGGSTGAARSATGVEAAAPPPLPFGAGGGGGLLTLKIQIAPLAVQIDGHTIVEATWPGFEQKIDTELADELGTIGIVLPSSTIQTAVSGVSP